MNESIIATIDAEIAVLERAKALLTADKPKRGRPAGSKNAPAPVVTKRGISEVGRARIAAAQKKRHAAKKRAAKKASAEEQSS